ncbi:MAG: FtsW/RodA/SpoVE family cell cycle protein [Prevotellaceae bacterium]|jgi:cell division protein FtsW|nr:FtsW/RodA/SpoVE family cell cycle protein [Prevotellaceae bacterium]
MEYLLNKIHFRGDKIIWAIMIVLFLISMLVISASADNMAASERYRHSAYWYFMRHFAFFAGGFTLIFICHRIPVSVYKKFATLTLIFGIALLLYASLSGEVTNGARRWIAIAGIKFQASEVAKIGLVLYLATVLEDNIFDDFKDVLKKIVLPAGAVCFLAFIEGTSIGLLFGSICMSILFIGGLKLKFFFKIFGIALAAFALLCISGITIGWPVRIITAVKRVNDFPFATIGLLLGIICILILILVFARSKLKYLFKICGIALAALALLFVLGLAFNWSPAVNVANKIENIFKKNDIKNADIKQADRGKIAVAAGGLVGKGPGNSTQRYLLNSSHSDFVFAIIVEEYGLTGGILVLFAYMALLYRAATIAKKCTRIFSSVTVLGLMLMLVLQAMTNMGVSVGIFPVTGQTLPFVSHGGTSILCTGITLGIILSISRAANNQAISNSNSNEKYAPDNSNEKITEIQ